LIGRSIALALERIEPPPAVESLDKGDSLERAAGADLIVLAAPIGENIRVLQRLDSHVPGTAIVTDTGSTKRTTVEAAAALPSRLRFIGGHPIAGAAGGGAANASADLFSGRRWILTPTDRSSSEDVEALRILIESLGASVHLMSAAEHDRLFAYLSHLPQLAVSALMRVVGDAVASDGLEFAGPGLHDSTRLAASPPSLWETIAADNRENVAAALSQLIAVLERLRDDPARLAGVFDDANRWKLVLDKTRTP
jgi:prephenate dehydrogenase